MGTETRIGIATGLVIVVVASVYFFYGSDRSESDLLMVSGARLNEVSAVSPDAASAGKRTARPPRNRPTARPAVSKPNKPARRAARPVGKSYSPGKTARTDAANRRATHPVKPRSTGLGTARSPAGGTTVVAARPKPPTRLRSEPSSILVEATKKNLEQNATNAGPKSAKTGKPKGARPKYSLGTKAPKSGEKRPRPKPGVHGPARKPGVGGTKVKPAVKPRRTAGALPKKAATPTRPPAVKKPVAVWPRRHTIAAGDTLSGISTRYYGTSRSVARILKANAGVKSPRNLKIGQVLVIPAPPASAKAKTVSGRPAPKMAKPSAVSARNPAAAGSTRTYRVLPGDSFYSIAKKMYGQPGRWKDIYAANRTLVKNSPTRLRPGMTLRIP